jgi:hypothetical protein
VGGWVNWTATGRERQRNGCQPFLIYKTLFGSYPRAKLLNLKSAQELGLTGREVQNTDGDTNSALRRPLPYSAADKTCQAI